ncbi:MAG TPA: arabinofuranosidase catalytic domain-containing protein, partial [Polyangiaceae bacterium]
MLGLIGSALMLAGCGGSGGTGGGTGGALQAQGGSSARGGESGAGGSTGGLSSGSGGQLSSGGQLGTGGQAGSGGQGGAVAAGGQPASGGTAGNGAAGAGGGAAGVGGLGGMAGATSGGPPGPCDIYQAAGTPCAAAHSTVRALYGAYSGPLYQVSRASDNTTKDIPVVAAGGFADSALQDSFCSGTTCTIPIIYDQSAQANHLRVTWFS